MKHRLVCLPIVFSVVLLAQSAWPAALAGQQTDSTARTDTTVVRLRPIEVIGSIVPALTGPSVRAGNGMGTLVIREQELRAWNPGLASEALQRAGASSYDDLGSSFKHSVVLRGFAVGPVVGMPQGISVFVDGVPVNEVGSGEVSFDLLPLEHVEHIEVMTGTASLLGPNSLGGAVNLVTQTGGGRSAAVEFGVGSHGQRSLAANRAGTIGGWDYYGGVGYASERGWRRRMSGERWDIFANFGSYDEQRGVRLQLRAAESDAETAGSLPLSVYLVRPDSNLTAGDLESLRDIQLTLSGYTQVSGGLGSVRLYARTSRAERFNANQLDDPDIRGFSHNRTLGLNVDWRVTRPVRERRLTVRAGGGATANQTAVELFAERIDARQTTHVESPITRYDVYGLVEWAIDPLVLSAGARFDAVRVPFRNRLNSARDTTSTFHQLSPRASVLWRLSKRASLNASLSRGFRAPALIEIACADPAEPCPLPFALGDDPPINAVRVTTYDAGLRWLTRRVQVDAAVYRSNVRDDIFLFPYDDAEAPGGSTIDGYFGNIPRTRREGLEIRALAVAGARTKLAARYAWTRASFQSEGIEIFSIREAIGAENEVEIGDRFPLVPAHTGSVSLDYERGALDWGASLNLVGTRFLRGDEANDEQPMAGYITADARAGYATGSWNLNAVLRNVADTRYLNFATFNINQGNNAALERFVTPGAPRSLALSLGYRF